MFKHLFVIIVFSFISLNALSIDEYLNKELSEYTKFEYETAALPADVNGLNDEKITYDSERNLKINGSYLYIPIELKKENNQTFKSTITLKVKLYKYVFIANRSIKKGDLISQADFSYEEKEVTGIRTTTEINFDKKYRAKVNINENSILELGVIEESPIINIGEEVNAFKVVGNVMVSFTAKARQEGKLGESIRVLRDDNKLFRAEVLDSLNVKIIE